MKNLPVELQAVMLLTTNGLLEAFQKVVTAVQPLLSPLLTLGQVVIALATIIWIFRRARGAKLDNRLKEIEIEKAEKK